MLQWFRTRARSLAATVLWSILAVTTLSSSAHDVECDDASEGVVRVHDPAAHRVSLPSKSDRPLHCFLCHWLRSFRADAVREWRAPVAVAASVPPAPIGEPAVLAAPSVSLPPRAPPA